MNLSLFVLLVPAYTLLLLLLLVTSTVGGEAVDSDLEVITEADLEVMTEAELEDICIKRGFQLINDDIDPDTGLVYTLTKQDYVEAAQRCLAIEKEMDDLLTEYPELADELEEEIKRMEDENAEKQSKVEELENQIVSNNVENNEVDSESMGFVKNSTSSSSNNNNDNDEDEDEDEENTVAAEDTASPNVAFTRGKKINYDDDEDDDHIVVSENVPVNDSIDDNYLSVGESTTTPTNNNIETDEMDSSSTITASIHNSTQTHENVNSDVEDDDINYKFVESDVEPLQDDTPPAAGSTGDDNSKEDFTLTHLAIESIRVLVKNAKDDVKRMIELVIPVMQPFLNAGNVAWRRVKVLFNKSREVYRSYQATSQSSSSKEEIKGSESVGSNTCKIDL